MYIVPSAVAPFLVASASASAPTSVIWHFSIYYTTVSRTHAEYGQNFVTLQPFSYTLGAFISDRIYRFARGYQNFCTYYCARVGNDSYFHLPTRIITSASYLYMHTRLCQDPLYLFSVRTPLCSLSISPACYYYSGYYNLRSWIVRTFTYSARGRSVSIRGVLTTCYAPQLVLYADVIPIARVCSDKEYTTYSARLLSSEAGAQICELLPIAVVVWTSRLTTCYT